MKTLNLEQAATLLHMHRVTLLLKAKTGIIPAAKPAKCWVFIEQDLIDYLRTLYTSRFNKKNEPIDFKSNSTITDKFRSKNSYNKLLGITDCPQIHSPKPVSRSGARHADAVKQVTKSEAVGLVVNSGNMPQSKRG
jgi:hypothetical protein